MTSAEFRAEARKNLQGKWGKVALVTLAFLFITFMISFIVGLLEGLFVFNGTSKENIEAIFDIAEAIISVPLGFGYIFVLLKIYNNEETHSFDFLSLGFGNFGRTWGVTFRMFLKMLAPIILLIISYIIIGVGVASMGITALTSSSDSSLDISTAIAGGSAIGVIGAILVVVSYIWLITKSYYYQLSYFVAMEYPEMSSVDCVQKSEDMMRGNRAKLFFLQFSIASFNSGILKKSPSSIDFVILVRS